MSTNAFQAVLAELVSEIEREAERLRLVMVREATDLTSDDPIAQLVASAAMGSMVAKIYTKAEEIFYKIATKIDEEAPTGDSWHRDLLLQMKVATDDRPSFLAVDSFESFDFLRRFRHFERSSYASEISPSEIPGKVTVALEAVRLLKRDFSEFSRSYFECEIPDDQE